MNGGRSASVQKRLDDLEIPKLQILRYMGNKRRLVRFIVPEISKLVKPGDVVLDLFSGSCAVGYGLKRHYIVYANDIQAYAEKIAEALLKWKPPSKPDLKLLGEIEKLYNKNMRELRKVISDPLAMENSFFLEGVDAFNWGGYKRFAEDYPYYGRPTGDGYSKQVLSLFADENIKQHSNDPNRFPYLLFSTYFANGYFGIRQAAQIDSLRLSIEKIDDSDFKKSFLLTCLISAASHAVSSTGHFAQFRNITSPEVCAEILSERRKDILTIFKEKYVHFSRELVGTTEDQENNHVFSGDYKEMFQKEGDRLNSVKAIYADPPYTPAQYSRFYHVLETLVRYDYPKCDFVGRYRQDRERSDFCRYRGFRKEFDKLADLASQFSPKLVISYSNNGLFEDISELVDIVAGYYESVNKIVFTHHHSKQGRPAKLDVDEYLIIGSQEKG